MKTMEAFAAGQSGTDSNDLAPQSETLAPDTHIQIEEDVSHSEETQIRPPNTSLPEQSRPREDRAGALNDQTQADEDQPLDDESQRRRVADRLSDQLDINVDLSSVCGRLAGIPNNGRMEAVYGAARLAQANAQLARSLAQLLKVERRQLTIVQHVQPAAPVSGHSNSSEQALPESGMIDGLLSQFFRYMKLYADEELGPALERAALKEKQDEAAATA